MSGYEEEPSEVSLIITILVAVVIWTVFVCGITNLVLR